MNNKRLELNNCLTDIKIIKGLYLTYDIEKMIRNCICFEIDILNNISNISKRNKFSILTLKISEDEFIQFIIKRNLKIKELLKLNNDSISIEIKHMIIEAFKLIRYKTNQEWIIEQINNN